jgi:phospholipid transport system transporter-binding protein
VSEQTSRFTVGTVLTHASAKRALADGLASIASGAVGADCAALAEFDSSALAVLLAWQRAAAARGGAFDVVNMPEGLMSLAGVYGVDAILSTQPRSNA